MAEEDLVVAYYNVATGQWVILPSTVDTTAHTITATVDHLTLFAAYAPVGPGPAPTPPPAPGIDAGDRRGDEYMGDRRPGHRRDRAGDHRVSGVEAKAAGAGGREAGGTRDGWSVSGGASSPVLAFVSLSEPDRAPGVSVSVSGCPFTVEGDGLPVLTAVAVLHVHPACLGLSHLRCLPPLGS